MEVLLMAWEMVQIARSAAVISPMISSLGLLHRHISADFSEFAELCFWEFGDRVKNWITLNEPYTYSVGGYVMGTTPPGRGASASDHVEGSYPPSQSIHCKHQQNCDGDPGTEPYLATHYQLLAHAAAVKLYREKFQTPQGGKIGITLVSKWMEPLDESSDLDVKASLRALDWFFGWFMEPITTGDYPQSMKEYVGSRLPKFTKLQSEMLRGSFDFLGLNYYTANYVSHGLTSDKGLLSYNTDPQVTYASKLKRLLERNGKPIGPPSASDWLSVYPEGMQKLLVYIKKTYKDPLIYITENGVDETNNVSLTVSEALNDTTRTEFLQDHLFYLRKAMDDDVNVKGYFMWSLLDNFEWNDGYSVRFGLVHVDYSNGYARHPKASAVWLMNFLRQGTNRRVVPQYSESRTISRDSEDFDASHESSSEDLPGLVQRTTKYPTTPSQDADEVLIEQDHHVTPPSKMDEDGLNETGNNAAMQIDDHQTLVQPPSDEPTQEKEATEASPSTTIPITVEPERSTQVNEPGELRAEEIQNEPVASVPVPEDSVPTQQVVTKDRRFTATVKRRIKSVSSKV
ncbi:hypothetical protein RJ640_027114 [Escallonia rubra]|uniref:Uncharacterized protein n=1 Tax=Escallonia rubra TaxID=112253 RepID=A0AA88UEA6_9ASTE|nr:hypothetical protein RJ640_027114 [Escallonia rubra]